MFTTIVLKELKSILVSPKFPVTFAVSSLLVLLSVFMGIREYRASRDHTRRPTRSSNRRCARRAAGCPLEPGLPRTGPDADLRLRRTERRRAGSRTQHVGAGEALRERLQRRPDFALFPFIEVTFMVQVG